MVAHQNGSDIEGMALSEAHTTPAKKPSQEAISSSKHLFSGANCYFQGLYLHPTLLFILHPQAIFLINHCLFVAEGAQLCHTRKRFQADGPELGGWFRMFLNLAGA